MRCPFCATLDNKVLDSRLSQGGEVTRRRRQCDKCSQRYTTYERIERTLPLVIKNDGRREPFDRAKILAGVRRACVKRPVSSEAIERLLGEVERDFAESGAQEVPSSTIGSKVLDSLRALDQVAYVRFASVYRDFQDAQEFSDELKALAARP